MTVGFTDAEIDLILQRFRRLEWEWGNDRDRAVANSVLEKLGFRCVQGRTVRIQDEPRPSRILRLVP